MTKTATKPVKKTVKKAATKVAVRPATNTQKLLPMRQQWLIIALLVVILFLFACFVYGADMFWYGNR